MIRKTLQVAMAFVEIVLELAFVDFFVFFVKRSAAMKLAVQKSPFVFEQHTVSARV